METNLTESRALYFPKQCLIEHALCFIGHTEANVCAVQHGTESLHLTLDCHQVSNAGK